MNEVFINIKNEDESIRKYFTTDLVSIDQLVGLIIDLDYEIDKMQEEIDDLKEIDEEKYDKWHWNKVDEVVDEMLMKESEN